MSLKTLIDYRVPFGTATNQVLVLNATTGLYEATLAPTGLESIGFTFATLNFTLGADVGNFPSLSRTEDGTSLFRLYSNAGLGADSVGIQIHGKGRPSNRTQREVLNLTYDPTGTADFHISTDAAGGGTVRDINIFGGVHTGQLLIGATGETSFSLKTNNGASLNMTDATTGGNYLNISTSTGTEKITLGNITTDPIFDFAGDGLAVFASNIAIAGFQRTIGPATDIDLLSLENDILTVNGDVDITEDLEVLGLASIGVANDTTLILKVLGADGAADTVGQGIGVVGGTGGDSAAGNGAEGGTFAFTSGDGGESAGVFHAGGRGGAFLFMAGVGGDYAGTGFQGTGGFGGSYEFESGRGGDAGGVGDDRIGGAGGNFIIFAGDGGDGADGTSSNTGGAGGDVKVNAGAGGTGATANGNDGNIFLGGTTGNVRIGDTKIPAKKLEVIGDTSIEASGAAIVPLTIKAATSQTAGLLNLTDDSDNILMEVIASGGISNLDGIRTVTTEYGAGLGIQIFGENTPEHTNQAGWYDHTGGAFENLFTKISGDDFTQDDADNGSWILFTTGTNLFAMCEIKEFIDADNVIVDGLGWDQDINSSGTPGNFLTIKHPGFITGDGHKHEFSVGATGEFEVVGYDFTNPHMIEFELNAAANGADCLNIIANANGNSMVQPLVLDYRSGDLGPGESGGAMGALIDVSKATSADATTSVAAYTAVVINGSGATSQAYVALPGFTDAFVVAGAAELDPDYGYEDTLGTLVDRVNSGGGGDDAFVSGSTNVEIFTNDDDNILIGNNDQYEIILYVASTPSSKDIETAFEYSTGVDTWATLAILSDGTVGFQQSGLIVFDAPGGWAKTNLSNGEAVTNALYVRMTRTRAAAIATLPVEDHFKVYLDREQGMRVRGDGTIKPVQMLDADAPNDSLYYSTTGGLNELVYKDTGGTVNHLY